MWVSPLGCLMFSVQVLHRDPNTALFVQYLMGLTIVDAIRGLPNCQVELL